MSASFVHDGAPRTALASRSVHSGGPLDRRSVGAGRLWTNGVRWSRPIPGLKCRSRRGTPLGRHPPSPCGQASTRARGTRHERQGRMAVRNEAHLRSFHGVSVRTTRPSLVNAAVDDHAGSADVVGGNFVAGCVHCLRDWVSARAVLPPAPRSPAHRRATQRRAVEAAGVRLLLAGPPRRCATADRDPTPRTWPTCLVRTVHRMGLTLCASRQGLPGCPQDWAAIAVRQRNKCQTPASWLTISGVGGGPPVTSRCS